MRLPTLPWFVECMRAHADYSKLGARVEFGREPYTRVTPGESIIIVDVQRGEGLEEIGALDAKSSPQRRSDGNRYHYSHNRTIAAEALIIAVATMAGARRQDHVELCDVLINNFVYCAYATARDKQKIFAVQNGGCPKPPEQEESALEAGYSEVGCRYLLRFFIDVPIVSKSISTVTIGPDPDVSFHTTLNVPFNGQDHEIEFSS